MCKFLAERGVRDGLTHQGLRIRYVCFVFARPIGVDCLFIIVLVIEMWNLSKGVKLDCVLLMWIGPLDWVWG